MVDTGFFVPPGKMHRLAVRHRFGPDGGLAVSEGSNLTLTSPPAGASGGGGLYGTAPDCLRFAQMLLNGGELNGVRLLSPRSIELMSRDHLTENERATYFSPVKVLGWISRLSSTTRRPVNPGPPGATTGLVPQGRGSGSTRLQTSPSSA